MVPYFPRTYPDELLYGVLARYHRHMCGKDPKRTVEDLFGPARFRGTHHLPGHLRALAANLPPERSLTAERLAVEFTLYPYYVAFASAAVRAAVLADLLDSPAKGVHLHLGCPARAVAPPARLRFCPVCCEDMEDRYDERYWRRTHQLPGVLVCPDHGVPLADSSVSGRVRHRLEFVPCTAETCPTDGEAPAWADDTRCVALLQDMASRSAALLSLRPAPPSDRSTADVLRSALAARGLAAGPRRIDRAGVVDAFAMFSAPLHAALPAAAHPGWLPAMTRGRFSRFHPLHHVLFEAFLDTLPTRLPSRPFGAAPWPCLNPLAEHHGQAVVTALDVRFDRGRTVGRFSCSCGYVYTRRAGSVAPVRVAARGPLFEEGLRVLVAEGKSLGATARALKVDRCTVRRHAYRLGLSAPWETRGRAEARDPAVRSAIHERWTSARREHPELSRKELAKRLPREHAWLYRHDRAWLTAQSPSPSLRRFVPESADWPRIDSALATALPGMAAAVAGAVPPERVTVTRLKRRMGLPAWIDRHRGKLPHTTAMLRDVVETVEAFQLRRVALVIAGIGTSAPPPPAWKVRQLAGLPPNPSPKVAAAIEGYCAASRRTPACR